MKYLVRLAWRLDQTVNRLSIITGHLAAWATRHDMRND